MDCPRSNSGKEWRRELRVQFFLFLALIPLFCFSQSNTNGAQASSADALLADATNAIQQGKLLAARTALDKAVSLAPKNAAAHNLLGWVLLANGDVTAAVEQFHFALGLDPGLAPAH